MIWDIGVLKSRNASSRKDRVRRLARSCNSVFNRPEVTVQVLVGAWERLLLRVSLMTLQVGAVAGGLASKSLEGQACQYQPPLRSLVAGQFRDRLPRVSGRATASVPGIDCSDRARSI